MPRSRWLTALFVAGYASLLLVALPHGQDWAAHAYRRVLFEQHGLTLWDNAWYGGRYAFIDYSVLYYPLASLVGMVALGVMSAVAAVLCFGIIVEREWGRDAVWAARCFALAWPLTLCTGALPFELGMAFGLLALVLLQRRRGIAFALVASATVAASPLAFVLLLVVVASAGVVRRAPSKVALWSLPVLAAGELAVSRIFPSAGRFPFPVLQLVAVLAFCCVGLVLTWRLERARLLLVLFGVYLVVCAGSFVVPSAIGENVARLRLFAFPVLMLVFALRNWRPVVPMAAILLLALSWNLAPVARGITQAQSDRATSAQFWRPAIAYLDRHLVPGERVEVVATADHWEAAYLPEAGIPIARGWFRQDDFPQNDLFYGRFGARRYRAWLDELAVRYVVLPSAPLDYSARAEAALLRRGVPGLRRVFAASDLVVYRVENARPLVTGPQPVVVTQFDANRIAVRLRAPGLYHVAVRYSRYWHASEGCVTAASGGMVVLHAQRPGVHVLRVAFNAEAAFAGLIGADAPACRG